MKDLTIDNFEDAIRSSDAKPVLVFVWAPWCSNCKHQKPLLEELIKQEPGLAEFTAVNAGEQTDLVKELKIMGVPTIMLYRHGVLVRKLLGVSGKKRLQKALLAISEFNPQEASANEYKSFWRKIMGR